MDKISKAYQALIEIMPDAYARHQLLTDEQGKAADYIFLEVNPAFESMTGLARADIIGKKVTDILPTITKSGFNWVEAYGRVALNMESLKLVQYSEPLNRWYEVYAFSTEQGYFETIFQDTTELHAVKAELTDCQKKFSALSKTIEGCILILNREGRVLNSNVNDYVSLLKTPDDLIDATIDDLFPDQLAVEAARLIDLAFKTGEMQTYIGQFDLGAGCKFYKTLFCQIDSERVLMILRENHN